MKVTTVICLMISLALAGCATGPYAQSGAYPTKTTARTSPYPNQRGYIPDAIQNRQQPYPVGQ